VIIGPPLAAEQPDVSQAQTMEPKPEQNIEARDGPCSLAEWDGAHASAIRRLIRDAPPFRPEAAPEELVAEFANGRNRMAAFLALYSRGAKALPAVRQGLQHANWHIRHWSAILADNYADGETRRALTSLLHDPKAEVRVWAVHSLSCERCKNGPNPVDVVPLLLERIERDSNIKVRRQAVAMLAHHRTPDPRVLPIFRKIISKEDDRKLRLHAQQGLRRYGTLGLGA
jgi:HEAT repeat protein